mmetsp:Transcript_96731/g.159303  ORF Transcript_96731/g.159303 Transcript_96731/m.159303 type:complete len:464 (-) Transcript_96731:74-1465(-)
MEEEFERAKHVDVLELDSSAGIFHVGLARLGRHLERLESRVERLEHENSALKSCLESAEVLRTEAFHAQLHQHRFAATLRTHPCEFEVTLPDLLLMRELRAVIGNFAGWAPLRGCGALDRTLRVMGSEIPHVVYVCGGFDGQQILASMVRFDPRGHARVSKYERSQTSSWSESTACVCRPRGSSSSDVQQSVRTQGVWETVAPMAQRRAGFAAAVVQGVLYVCGGYDGQVFLRSAERFKPCPDPDPGVWEPVAPMTQCRHCAAAASLNGRFYICGGYDGREALSSAECYDPDLHIWAPVAPMAQRRHGAAAAVLKGKLYVCGGYDGEEALNSTERYDPKTGVWETIPPMQQRRNVAFAVVLAGRLYVCSGCNGKETLNTMERYDPESNEWETTTEMQQRRHGAAAAVAEGQLFVCGGGDSADVPGRLLHDVERFDPSTSAWTSCTAMNTPLIDMAAVSMFAPV